MNSFVHFPTLADAAEHMRVGDRQQMDYARLKSTLTSLRALKDGRRWSMDSVAHEDSSTALTTRTKPTTFYLVRKA